jgi:hypothetical protein
MMKYICRTAVLLAFGTIAQQVAAQEAAAPATAVTVTAPAAAPPTNIILKRDTPVQMMATKEISTADASAGTRFRLRINEAITVGGRTIVPVGAWATGEVTSAKASGGLGKSGKMEAKLLFIEMGDLQIPLQGEMAIKGQGAGSAGMAIIFSGMAGLFHRGNNAKIKAGELVHGFVSEDVTLDISSDTLRRVDQGS